MKKYINTHKHEFMDVSLLIAQKIKINYSILKHLVYL